MRRFLTLVIGLVLGICLAVGAMLTTSRLEAGQIVPIFRPPTDQPATRLIEIPAPRGQIRLEGIGSTERIITPPPALVFFRDVKSDGCWLAAVGDHNEAIALAVAPADACR